MWPDRLRLQRLRLIMSGDEYKHLSEAQRELQRLLERKGVKGTVRNSLRRALEAIQRAMNWGEDETVSGCTDD